MLIQLHCFPKLKLLWYAHIPCRRCSGWLFAYSRSHSLRSLSPLVILARHIYYSDWVLYLLERQVKWFYISSLSFSFCYVFKSRKYNVHLVAQYSFFLHSPCLRFVSVQTEISGKYNSPLYFCFIFLYFSYHSSCREDQFTVLILKFRNTW